MKRLFLLLLLSTGLTGCYTAARIDREPPAYVRASDHYRDFAGADELSAYLRYNSSAGPLLSAHRGGPVPAYPENALATFERALRFGPALIEVDVRMSRDSVLVLNHDDALDRTTTGQGDVDDYSFAELRRFLLEDNEGVVTPYRMPSLDEALAWAEGRAVLTLDIKRSLPPQRVVDAVRRMKAEDRVVLIVYTLDDVLRYHRLAPDLMISAAADTEAEVDALLASGVDLSRLIVFTGVGKVNPAVVERLHAAGIRAMLGTFGRIDESARRVGSEVYHPLLQQGIDVLATDDVAAADRAIDTWTGRR